MKQVSSMTGFGRAHAEDDHFQVVVEVKAVNHRFKDVRIKMPSSLNLLELEMKKQLESIFSRGSFEVYVSLKRNAQLKGTVDLDYSKVEKFLKHFYTALSDDLKERVQLNPTDFIRADFYVEEGDIEEKVQELVSITYKKALDQLKLSRQEEGQKVVGVLKRHLQEFEREFEKVKSQKNSYQTEIRDKLLARLTEEKNLEVDDHRFNQEVIYYLEKLDIDEEVDRLEIHAKKLEDLLESHGEVGRKIDFLMQEFNRETNTIGSKSASSIISQAVVEMKTHLEKIREQALNLE